MKSFLMAYSHYQHILITSNDFRYSTKQFALQDFPTTVATARYDAQGATALLMMRSVYVCVCFCRQGKMRRALKEGDGRMCERERAA